MSTLKIKEIYEIEEKQLHIKDLVCHQDFSHAVDETNDITGAVCSIYFKCSNHPAGHMFVGVGEIKDLPHNIKPIQNPMYRNFTLLQKT